MSSESVCDYRTSEGEFEALGFQFKYEFLVILIFVLELFSKRSYCTIYICNSHFVWLKIS